LEGRSTSASTLNAGSPQVIKMSEIEIEEIAVGTKVSFGRPESRVEPAVGYVEKVNRMTYQIRLCRTWVQQRRTYPQGGRFRVSKGMVVRYLGDE